MDAARPTRTATVVVVPRERFSFACRSLERLLERTPGVALVYVDAGSPPAVRRYLEARAKVHGFTYVRHERFLSPNASRNLGLRSVRTPYAVFVDNDVIVEPHWLEPLVACADETGAAVVGPLYHIDVGGRVKIHMAGGDARFENDGDRRTFVEHHHLGDLPVAAAPQLERRPCDIVEFHTMLVRTSLFERIGPLDEGLRSIHEHVDLCLLARDAGCGVYFEPRSVVTYVPASRLQPSDLAFYMLRWSERWNRASVARFNEKWRLDARHPTNRKMIVLGRHIRVRGMRLIRERKTVSRPLWLRDRVVVLAEKCFNLAYAAVAGI